MTAPALVLTALQLAAPPDLQAVLDELVSVQDVPGISATVTQEDRVLFSGGSGVADLETGEPMTADTRLYAGSLTKILTATLALALIERGELSLEQPVDGIADDAEITVRQLMAHTSGLEREGNFGYWFNGAFPDRAALAQYLDTASLRTPPGADAHYSNIGYAALGLTIEAAAGRPYGEALQTEVARPLGLASTGAPGPVKGIAPGYTPRGRVIPNESRPFAGVGRPVGARRLREYHDAAAMAPAFGAYTTSADLGRVARFLLGYSDDRLLGPDFRRLLLEPSTAERSLGLGIGRYLGRPVARHGGWFAAHRSYLLIDLDDGIGVAVIANSDNARPGVIAETLLSAVLGEAAAAD